MSECAKALYLTVGWTATDWAAGNQWQMALALLSGMPSKRATGLQLETFSKHVFSCQGCLLHMPMPKQ